MFSWATRFVHSTHAALLVYRSVLPHFLHGAPRYFESPRRAAFSRTDFTLRSPCVLMMCHSKTKTQGVATIIFRRVCRRPCRPGHCLARLAVEPAVLALWSFDHRPLEVGLADPQTGAGAILSCHPWPGIPQNAAGR